MMPSHATVNINSAAECDTENHIAGDFDPATGTSSSSSYLRQRSTMMSDSQRALLASYRKFYFLHCLALLPTLAILIVILVGSIRSRDLCHITQHSSSPSLTILKSFPSISSVPKKEASRVHAVASEHPRYEKGRCTDILDLQLLLSTLALGLVGWLASYTSRKACLFVAEKLIPRVARLLASLTTRRRSNTSNPAELTPEQVSDKEDAVVITTAIALQAVIAESLRVLSFFWSCTILISSLYLYPKQDWYRDLPNSPSSTARRPLDLVQAKTEPDWAWRVSFRDPRFFVAIWSSIAWALAEFLFGGAQMLHQVGLYNPASQLVGIDDSADDQNEHLVDIPRGDVPAGTGGDNAQSRFAGQSGFTILSGNHHNHGSNNNKDTNNKGIGKGKQLNASKALEEARQRLVQPGRSDIPKRYGSTSESASPAETASQPGPQPGSVSVAIDNDADEEAEEEMLSDADLTDASSTYSISSSSTSILNQEIEHQVTRYLLAKERSEVEAVLGVPLPAIPIALCSLWRIDAMLWSIGSNLLLSSAFTYAQGHLGHLKDHRFDLSDDFQLFPNFFGHDSTSNKSSFGTTFILLILLHTVISTLWATQLPSIGFAKMTYASLLFGLGILIAGMARWGLLI